MLQPHDSIVFRDSLTGQLYASFSWIKKKRGLNWRRIFLQAAENTERRRSVSFGWLPYQRALCMVSTGCELWRFHTSVPQMTSHWRTANTQREYVSRQDFLLCQFSCAQKKGWATQILFLMCSSYLFQTPLLMDVLCILGYEVVQLLRDRHTVDTGLRSSLYKRKIMLTKETFAIQQKNQTIFP